MEKEAVTKTLLTEVLKGAQPLDLITLLLSRLRCIQQKTLPNRASPMAHLQSQGPI